MRHELSYRVVRAILYPALLAGLMLVTSSDVRGATTITVTSTAQEATSANPNGVANGNCTLGEAIVAANTNTTVDACVVAGGGAPYTIVLSQATYTLASTHNFWYGPNALPPIAQTIIIEGNGALLQATAATRLRFFFIGGPANGEFFSPGPGNLTLRNVTLTGGRQQGGSSPGGGAGAGMGGAIFNQGTLTLDSVTMNNNRATGGSSAGNDSLTAGGGMGSDVLAFGVNGGGFGGTISGGSTGGVGTGFFGAGGGGGGFKSTDNGAAATTTTGGNGGGIADGLGGLGGYGLATNLGGSPGVGGHGSGGGGGAAPEGVPHAEQ